VLAAAVKSGAQVIVTSNLKHFPAADLRQWDVEAKSPDDFVLDQVGIDGRAVAACVQQIPADSRTRCAPVDAPPARAVSARTAVYCWFVRS
jgi:hypothetical protein